MATPKKNAAPAPAPKADPFKVKQTSSSSARGGSTMDTVKLPADLAAAVDSLVDAKEQKKHYEGEETVYKNKLAPFAADELARRILTGKGAVSFKLQGEETQVTYVVTERGTGLTEEDVEKLAKEVGDAAAEKMVKDDFGSLRFDAAVLEANYDAVVAALQTLPEEVVGALFKPMTKAAVPGAAEMARGMAKDPAHLARILAALKLTAYLK